MHKHGFSLVELSIVLVILGLLTGGILAGQNLIRASELRTVSTQFNSIVSATHTFRDKYFALPGDFRDATKFWGRLNTNGACVTNSAKAVATPGACDGDGDGRIENGATAGQAAEMFGFWQHLANAGLIEGNYTGLSGAANGTEAKIGENVMRGKISNTGWSGYYIGTYGDAATYTRDYGNLLAIGAEASANIAITTSFTPEELWNIDTKMDDGQPGYGRVVAWNLGNTIAQNRCTINATSTTDLESDYNLTYSAKVCTPYFVNPF